MKYIATFTAGGFYHVFNHAVGNKNLFRNADNFRYFLKKYALYMLPVCDTYAYCLMPNHFHFLIKIKPVEQLQTISNFSSDIHKFVIQPISNWLNAYAKAYNKQYNRKGALFLDYTKRIAVKSDNYFVSLVNYIHPNPVHHGFCSHCADWEYSSYLAFLSARKSNIQREEVLTWFGDAAAFKQFHLENSGFLQDELEFY